MKDVMTRKECAEYMGISLNTLDKWRKDGLVVNKIDRAVFISAQNLLSFLKDHEVSDYEEWQK